MGCHRTGQQLSLRFATFMKRTRCSRWFSLVGKAFCAAFGVCWAELFQSNDYGLFSNWVYFAQKLDQYPNWVGSFFAFSQYCRDLSKGMGRIKLALFARVVKIGTLPTKTCSSRGCEQRGSTTFCSSLARTNTSWLILVGSETSERSSSFFSRYAFLLCTLYDLSAV